VTHGRRLSSFITSTEQRMGLGLQQLSPQFPSDFVSSIFRPKPSLHHRVLLCSHLRVPHGSLGIHSGYHQLRRDARHSGGSPNFSVELGFRRVPSLGPDFGLEYFVYYCAPTYEYPMGHWAFIPTTTNVAELPDIRAVRPTFLWSSVSDEFHIIEAIAVKI
jgi:hypothetical protein